ncbi:MAG: hypothetical protein ACXVIJ_03120 [Thermoanaerobaculia bacterium]
MRYRTACLAAAVVFVCATAFAGPEPAVVVARPLMKVVNNVRQLREVCTPDGDFDACTRFVAFRLNAACAKNDERWTIEASATFRPWIFLYNMKSLSHEQLHIDDIRTYTERFISELGREQFSSRDVCEASALSAVGGFEQKMRDFAERSNAERHRAYARLQVAMRGR